MDRRNLWPAAALLAAAMMALGFATAGCSRATAVDSRGTDLGRIGPDEYGVVCYRDTWGHGIALSCVQVRPPAAASGARR